MKAGEIWKSKETGEEAKISLVNDYMVHRTVIYEMGGVSKVNFDKEFYAKFEKVSESNIDSLVIDINHELEKRLRPNCVISSTNSMIQIISNHPTSSRDEIHTFVIANNTSTGVVKVKDYNDSEEIYVGSIVDLNKEELVEKIVKRVNEHRDMKISHLKGRVETLEGFGFY